MTIITIVEDTALRFTQYGVSYIVKQYLDDAWVETDEPAHLQVLNDLKDSGLMYDKFATLETPVLYLFTGSKTTSHRLLGGIVTVTAQETVPLRWSDLFLDVLLDIATSLKVTRRTLSDYLVPEDDTRMAVLTLVSGEDKEVLLVKAYKGNIPVVVRVKDGKLKMEEWDSTHIHHRIVQHSLLNKMELEGIFSIVCTATADTLVTCEPVPAKGESTETASETHISASTSFKLVDAEWEEYLMKLVKTAITPQGGDV